MLEGVGHAPTRSATRSDVNLLLRDFLETTDARRRPQRPKTTWTRALSRPRRALYISSPIGLGHAQRDVAIAAELRKLHPDLEIDWLAQHPVTSVLEAHGERIHPAERLARERIGPHHLRGRRSRPQRLPGDPAHGRDPRRQLHGVPRRRRGRRVRPRHRRRGVGRRLLPPREPGAQAHGLRLDDRLRRLAPDARRRRARGVPDGRLQRRDDRARRALPAPARPGDLRRRPRRHRARRLRARACPPSATGPSGTSRSRAT